MADEYGNDEGAEGSGNNVYTVLLVLSFLMIAIGTFMCWKELGDHYQAPTWAAGGQQ